MAHLLALPQNAVQSRSVRAITLMGEPGMGKRRLLRELQAAQPAATPNTCLMLTRAHSSLRLQPYGLLRSLLAVRPHIADSDALHVARARLANGVVPWLGDGGLAKAQLIGQLTGLGFSDQSATPCLEPSALRKRAFAA